MIRHATKYDIPILLEMIKEYAQEFPSEIAKDTKWFDEKYISTLLYTMIVGKGFIFIDEEYRGFIAAIISSNVWYPKLNELNELAWWVKPEYRESTIGGKLWLMFDKEAQKLKEENRINVIKTSLTINSPKIDYCKRGYKEIETAYIKE